MIRCARQQGCNHFPQQGRTVGWVAWAVIAVLSFLGLSRQAEANTFNPTQMTFGATPVSSTSPSAFVTVAVQQAGSSATPVVYTEGTSSSSVAEFTLTGTGTCYTQTLTQGTTCTVGVTFSPRFPGIRHGAVVLQASGGQWLGSTLISGMGQGSLPVLIPGQIGTVAGDNQWFYQADGVPATQAPIQLPSGLAVDGAGNLYLADTSNNRVRRVDAATQIITTVAGTGTGGVQGDNGLAVSAELNEPAGIALDGAGNLYIADAGNHAIRRVDASGKISTVAGTLGTPGVGGDGGPATSARLNNPQGIALTVGGDLLIADTNNNTVRLVSATDGTIQIIAGTGTPGYNGDGIPATRAQLNAPWSVALRSDGAIAIADLSNNRVRLMTAGGNITTVAGNGTQGYSGDGAAASQAELNEPAAVVFDPAGDLIVADNANDCVRLVYGSSATITTLVGTPGDDRFAGDGGPENQARMHGPDGLFFDAGGNLWVADRFNNRIREISGTLLTIGPYPTMKVGKLSQPVGEAMINAGNQPLILGSPSLNEAKLDPTTTTCGQAALAAGDFCQMGIDFAPTEVANVVHGSVTWSSNAPYVTAIDQLYGEVLSVEPTTAVIASSKNPGLLGQSLTLTATITSADTGRTGTVDFVEGSTTWCSARQVTADGTASCQIPSLSLGDHSFVANYSGDNNNAASQSAPFIETIKQQAALALGVSGNPATVTNNVTLVLHAQDATGTPTGTATFYDGSTALKTITLDANGNASWTTNALTVGTHALSAQYAGDTGNAPGTSNTISLEVDKATAQVLLASSSSNATVGTSVTFTAHVLSNNGPAPTGTVELLDGSVSLGSSPIDSNGLATFSVNSLSPGSHSITAAYSGDADTSSNTSAALAETIAQISTTTTPGADVDPLSAGATVHLSAIVQIGGNATADGAVTGTVTFSEGNTVLGFAPVNSSGQATLPLSSLPVGSHVITMSYSGNTNYAASTSSALTETVQKTATVTALSSAATSTLMGKPAEFSVSVTSMTGLPTGSVVFQDGALTLGTVPVDSHGSATYSTSSLSAGNHTITATYNGDANYLGSTSAPRQQTIALAQTSLTLGGPTGVVDAGTAVDFAVALDSPGVAPSGTLTLLDNGSVLAAQPATGVVKVTFTYSRLTPGTHTLVASYSGDANNAAANATAITVIVRQAPTATSLVPSANPLTQNQTLTVTATVTSDSPNLGNTVSFYDGTTLLGTAPLSANATASFAPQNLSLGVHNLTAIYSGDSNHANSTSTAVPELVVQSSSLALSSSANPSVSGQDVVFTGQMRGTPTPTGTLSFRDNGALLATVPLDGTGTATFATTALSVGSHAIAVTYSGDNNFSTAQVQVTQAVLLASTATTIAANANPATYATALTLSATVTSNGGAATGTVNFNEAGAVVGSAKLDATHTASFTTSSLSPGTHVLVANYVGDGKANASASTPLNVVVKQIASLAVASDVNPGQTLSAIRFTATVTSPGAAATTGTVTFTEDAQTLGTALLDGTGHASITLPQMAAGTHGVLASYAGDGANFGSQSSAYSQVIQVRPTSTTLTGTSTDTSNPQQITLIAVVHGQGSVPPGGTVTFTSGAITLGVSTVDSTGVATVTVIFDTPTQKITASYSGDASYGASASAPTPITAGTPAQFTLALSSANVTLVSHQRTILTVTLASVKGFTDDIQLGCMGLPFAATCTFDKSQLKLNGNGTATAALTLDTGNPLGAGSNTAGLSKKADVLLCLSPASLLLLGLRKRKSVRKLPTLAVALLAAAVASSVLTGCSGLQMNGTPPGTYSFTVIGTGQGSNVTEGQPVTMVVTQ